MTQSQELSTIAKSIIDSNLYLVLGTADKTRLALYKSWLSLNEKYRQLISRQPVAVQIKTTTAAA
jgi:hypothetical protein